MRRAVGHVGRVVDDAASSPSVEVHVVLDAGRGGEEVQVVLALEALLHDLHVEQAEEAAAEPEAERLGGLRLVGERGIVQRQLLERVAQLGEVVWSSTGIEAAEDHRLGLAVAGQRLGAARRLRGDRVADLQSRHVLDAGR